MSDADVDLRSAEDLSEGSASGVPFWGDHPGAWETVIIAGKRLPGLATVKGRAFGHRTGHHKAAGVSFGTTALLGSDPAEFEVVVRLWTAEHLRTFEQVLADIKPRFSTAMPAKTASAAPAVFGRSERQPPDPVVKTTSDTDPGGVSIPNANGAGGWTKSGLEVDLQQSIARPSEASSRPIQELRPLDIRHPALELYKIRSALIYAATLPDADGHGAYTVKLSCREYRAAKSVGVTTAKGSSDLSITKNIKGAFDVGSSSLPSKTNAGPG